MPLNCWSASRAEILAEVQRVQRRARPAFEETASRSSPAAMPGTRRVSGNLAAPYPEPTVPSVAPARRSGHECADCGARTRSDSLRASGNVTDYASGLRIQYRHLCDRRTHAATTPSNPVEHEL